MTTDEGLGARLREDRAPARPAVSVVLPCRNMEAYIAEALDSMLAQTHGDFELILIDNASKDRTPEIAREYAERDSRIVFLQNERDLGIAGSLNRGLRAARGKFIARMDADDVAAPERLEKQLAYMREHPDCVICGCQIELIDSDGRRIGKRNFPVSDRDIKKRMLMEIPFCHPATLVRRAPILEHGVFYDESIRTVEDRDFWIRLSDFGTYANLDETLMRYRVSESSMKYTEARRTLADIVRLQLKYLRRPEFRGVKILLVVAAESVLLLMPRAVITALYKLKYRG